MGSGILREKRCMTPKKWFSWAKGCLLLIFQNTQPPPWEMLLGKPRNCTEKVQKGKKQGRKYKKGAKRYKMGNNFAGGKVRRGKSSSGKKFVTCRKFRHFSPTKFSPINSKSRTHGSPTNKQIVTTFSTFADGKFSKLNKQFIID